LLDRESVRRLVGDGCGHVTGKRTRRVEVRASIKRDNDVQPA
jgi:hypothetical protein